LLVDFASISATKHEAEGAGAHRVFLGCEGYGERTALLVEDCAIPDEVPPIQRLLVVPWMIEGLDSAPCTVWAEVDG
jgi:kynurenine formamidase